jgi:dienelactone hydrolase
MTTNAVLFHSALGRRPAVLDWARRLRDEGLAVEVPDLYDGHVYDDLEEGMAYGNGLGIPELVRRARVATAHVPAPVLYAGFSGGAAAALAALLARPDTACGAVLMHGALPLAAFDAQHWPDGVPVEVHYAEADPFVDQAAVDALGLDVEAAGGSYEVFTYPGGAHLFADPGAPDYDRAAAELMWERVSAFARAVGRDAA